MFDPDTVAVIARAPALEGLDLARLPQTFTEVYAEIVAARIRIRQVGTGQQLPESVRSSALYMKRLASAEEAFVAVSPLREDRSAAAFVAGAAHHACMLAELAGSLESPRPSYLSLDSISPDVSAALLFLVAEASTDAAEIAKRIRPAENASLIEARLLSSISDLATGRLGSIISRTLPSVAAVGSADAGTVGTNALYLMILRGVYALAGEMLGEPTDLLGASASQIFENVVSLSKERIEGIVSLDGEAPYNIFPGPHHLAKLLQAVARDFPASALVAVPPPDGIPSSRWEDLMKQMAKHRPYVWRNHREAIAQGYLETGTSAAVSFPTGGGKSKLAELKIAASLLRGVKVIFLVPTLALVDQTATALSKTFPQAQVQRELVEELIFSPGVVEPLPSISVLTPERCLAMLSFSRDVFEDVGLIVFDECHLLHPRNIDTSRRSIDAMLCFLNLSAIADTADILLLSAMMKNTHEIADWLHEITGRPCLALDIKWKPTRQVRGCVVYASETLNDLRAKLTETRRSVKNKSVPAALKRNLKAQPFGFFCLRQTWVSKARNDYALLPLLQEEVTLSTGNRYDGAWYLTPNGNQVSAAIGAATSATGLKTLIFAQTIPLCKSTCNAINEAAGDKAIRLTETERSLYRAAEEEAGGAEHLYIRVAPDGTLLDASACHHGLLIPPERHLHEELFRRSDGISALVATSTLAQGMNLPSEVVIIAGDSRFDPDANRLEQLDAHELLNAAGRAGRAGEASQGLVLIVPSKVVDFQSKTNQIHSHWSDLQAIFSQSDQCLQIDDPFAALLDQVHAASEPISASAKYLLSRLPKGSGPDPAEPASHLISRSFAAFRARRSHDAQWIKTRTEAAIRLRNADPDITNTWIDEIAAASGIPARLLTSLVHHLLASANAGALPQTTAAWRTWLFTWLRNNPSSIPQLMRPESLEGMFGTPYKRLKNDDDRGIFALSVFEQMLPAWMSGDTLATLEKIAGTPIAKIGKCERAREFVLRIVPELSYLHGILAQLYTALFPTELVVPINLATLGTAVREGLDSPEKVALRQIRSRRPNRIAIHREYQGLAKLMPAAGLNETLSDVIVRVESAVSIRDVLG
ncbi:DEAD/DEAH box helicase [Bradyrhizobium sp. DASA03007]|uniref:DEAD/DEAH box helicase n=1 Tax=unclassified Bradyrhizobium TaxID=2631580 RepID=UPI003F705B0C